MTATKTTIIGFVGLALVLGVEAIVFRTETAAHYAWIYPRWADQLQYLDEAYRGYERMQNAGFASAAWEALIAGTPQGSLHALFALIAFAISGPGRNSVLAVNMAAFLLLQLATFTGARRVSGSTAWALASAAFLASFQFPWVPGSASAVDFRLDWLAVCAFGITVASAVSGAAFRSYAGAALFGVAVGLAILTRFLSVMYFGAILVCLVVWLLSQPGRRVRCTRLLLSAAVASLVCGPVLWLSRQAIYRYYWQSILDSPDSTLRGTRLDASASASWILVQLFKEQVGMMALGIAVGAAALLILARRKSAAADGESARPGTGGGEPWIVAGIFLAAPACVLVFLPFKDPQHVSILLVPVAWLFWLTWYHLAKRVPGGASAAVACCVVAASVGQFIRFEAHEFDSAKARADYRTVDALGDYLYFRSEEAGLDEPTVSVTGNFEGLYAPTFEIMGFERHQRRLRFKPGMPTPLAPLDMDAVFGDLRRSDFVCLVSGFPPSAGFNSEMVSKYPEMKSVCEANLRRVGDLEVLGSSIELYESRTLGPAREADLGTLVRRALAEAGGAPVLPPGAPLFIAPARMLASTRVDFRFKASAAYSPISYAAEDLPVGIQQLGATADLEGRFVSPGDFAIKVVASNSVGSKACTFSVHVEDKDTYAILAAPASCKVGAPVEISYGAYDARAKLDFIEITDLSARKTLGRVEVPPGFKQSWLGTYRVVFDKPGRRDILTRTVRFDPENAQHYSFEDHTCPIEVAP